MIVELALEDRADATASRRPTSTPPSSPTAGSRDATSDGAFGFSLVTAAGRSSLGSTFLAVEPDPRD